MVFGPFVTLATGIFWGSKNFNEDFFFETSLKTSPEVQKRRCSFILQTLDGWIFIKNLPPVSTSLYQQKLQLTQIIETSSWCCFLERIWISLGASNFRYGVLNFEVVTLDKEFRCSPQKRGARPSPSPPGNEVIHPPTDFGKVPKIWNRLKSVVSGAGFFGRGY